MGSSIPIEPGPWSFLQNIGQGAAEFLRGREERRRYDQQAALSQSGVLAQLANLGILDAQAAGPQLADVLARAGIQGINPNAAILPSPEAAKARVLAPVMAKADPTTTQGQLTLGLPTGEQITGANLRELLAAIQTKA